MAERRMFAKTIIDSDAFLDMPLSAQSLYFHLAMRADDDGFVNNPKKIQRMIGASDDDCRLLIAKRFVLLFDSGVIVIKHWKMHNYIQSDRYTPTVYQSEKAQLTTNFDKSYTEVEKPVSKMDTQCIRTGYSLDTQVSIGKDSIGKDSIGKKEHSASAPSNSFVKPTLEEVKAYCEERKNTVNAEHFIDYYTSNGWKVGRNPMKDWKAAVRTWEQKEKQNGTPKQQEQKSKLATYDWNF